MIFSNTHEAPSFFVFISFIFMQLSAITMLFIVKWNFLEGQDIVFNFFVNQVASGKLDVYLYGKVSKY